MEQVKTIGEAVRNMSVHMANMYYYMTKAVIEDFGDEAKESFKRAMMEFGHARGKKIAARSAILDDTAAYGLVTQRGQHGRSGFGNGFIPGILRRQRRVQAQQIQQRIVGSMAIRLLN